MKLFIGLTEVSGYYHNLKKGFEELGVECVYVPLQAHAFEYPTDEKLPLLPRVVRFCVSGRVHAVQANIVAKLFWFAAVTASRIALFIWAVRKCDVFLLGGGSSFFRFREMPLLRFLGKKVVYTFHGTDSRPPYIDGFCENVPSISRGSVLNGEGGERRDPGEVVDPKVIATYVKVAKRRKRHVAIAERYANVVVNAPPQGQFHTRPFVIGLAVGIPLDPRLPDSIRRGRKENDAVCVLHSPSRLEGKGTFEIRGAIDGLRRKGHRIQYVEISGRPNDEVIAAIQEADFVVDQVYSDNPMAGFAAEAALRGKAAVVAGYYSMSIHEDIPGSLIPPSLYCHPAELESAIERLIVDVDFRIKLGREAQEFVKKYWRARCVAERYLQLVRNEFPDEWTYDPRRNRYVYGMGLTEARARANVRGVVERFGRAGLLLGENPDLEEMFVKFAYEGARGVGAAV